MSTNQTTAGSGRTIDNHRSSQFSPAVIAVIGLLGAAFLLVSYYTMMAKFCTSRNVFRRRIRRRIHVGGAEDRGGGHVDDAGAAHVVDFGQQDGLDQSIIEAIPVLKYGELLEKASDANTPLIQDHRRDDTNSKDYGVDAGTDQPLEQCAVCLSDFQRDESVRLLPLCRHAFHVSCIDMWLRSHSNCPLCRAKIIQDVIQDQPCQPLNNSPVISPSSNNNHGPSASSTPSLISAPEGLRYDSNRVNNSSQGAAPATTDAVELAVIGHDRGARKSSADAITSSAQPLRAESSSQRSMGMSNMGLRYFSFERPPRIMADDQDLWTVKMKRSSSLTSCPRAWINQMEQAQTSIDVLCRNSTLRIHSDRSGIVKEAERGRPARQTRLVHNYDGQHNQHPPSSSSSASSSTGTLPRHSFKSRSLNNDIKNEVINGSGAVAELESAGPGKSNTKATELAGDMAGRSTMLSFKGLRSLSGGRLFGFRAKHSSDQIWPDPL